MTLWIAHRGESTAAPEQTMPAFRRAFENGMAMVEADVQQTADGVLVMMHDEFVDRTTDGHGAVAELTMSEISRLDAGGWFSPEFIGEHVPTLDELIALADHHGASLCIEVKGSEPGATAALAVATALRLQRRGRLETDALSGFDPRALMAAAAAVPDIRLAPDRLPERGPTSADSLISQAQMIGAPIIQHHFADLDVDTVEKTQEAGIELWAWPVNDPADIEHMLHLGVAGIMGDDTYALAKAAGAPGS